MLPETGFLADASDELRAFLVKLASEVEIKAGETLFSEGDPGDALYVMIEGSLEISILSEDGRKLGLDVMRAGAMFGEIALFDPSERTATATALTACRLVRVRNAELMQEIERDPRLAIDMIRMAGRRMRLMNRQLNEHVFLTLPARLARKILYLSQSDTDSSDTLQLSQAELAEFVGATREAVSKALATWKKSGLINPVRGGLVILDRAGLRAIAGESTV